MQRLRSRFEGTDSVTLAIVTGAFLLLLVIILPRVIPGGRFGVSCSELANPIPGGNNQSLLSRRSTDSLGLELRLGRATIAPGESLPVTVTFVNNGVGTITLFLVPREALLRDDGNSGLSFVIERATDGAVFEEPLTIRPPIQERTQFPNETLHLLGPKQRCTEPLTLEANRLSNLVNPGIGPLGMGSYTIQAIYRNRSSGAVVPEPGAIATPIFNTQGAYVVDELRSAPVTFTIGNMGQPAG